LIPSFTHVFEFVQNNSAQSVACAKFNYTCMLHLDFDVFPELQTERLLLRNITHDDVKEVYFLRSDREVLKYINKNPVENLEQAHDFISLVHREFEEKNAFIWAIAEKDKPAKLIGNMFLWKINKLHHRAEVGYVLHPDYWRKGIMKEVLSCVVDFSFDRIGLHSLEARIHPGNEASAMLLEKSGFTREAYFKEDFYFNGEYLDTVIYSRLHS